MGQHRRIQFPASSRMLPCLPGPFAVQHASSCGRTWRRKGWSSSLSRTRCAAHAMVACAHACAGQLMACFTCSSTSGDQAADTAMPAALRLHLHCAQLRPDPCSSRRTFTRRHLPYIPPPADARAAVAAGRRDCGAAGAGAVVCAHGAAGQAGAGGGCCILLGLTLYVGL